jgi:hypothetical protein
LIMDHRWARKPVLVNRWAGATRTEEKQREGAPWRRAAGTFRKNPNLFPSHGSVLKLLSQKESAVEKAAKRNPTEVKAIVGTSTQGDGMKDLRREIP